MAQTTSPIVANLTDAQVAAIIAVVQTLSVSQVSHESANGPALTGAGAITEAAAPLPVTSVSEDVVTATIAATTATPVISAGPTAITSTTSATPAAASSTASTAATASSTATASVIGAGTTAITTAGTTAASSTTDIPDVHGGIICAQCGHFNPDSEIRWYAITRGKEVGVFNDWLIVHPLISGVRHAAYKKYKTEAAAETAFEEALLKDAVRVIL